MEESYANTGSFTNSVIDMEKISRKSIRLKEYDYRSYGGYFITMCTANREPYLWKSDQVLSEIGKIADDAIQKIPNHYPGIYVDKYVIMPNHIHILFMNEIENNEKSPSVSRIVQQLKGVISKQAGFPLWQKSFYDRVIRCQGEYDEIWKYIEENPMALWMDRA